jgi:U3 small nucleolar RNA-associated protein 12
LRTPELTPCVSLSLFTSQIWNPKSGACLRSVECGYGLCAAFAPGARHALVGTKSGGLVLLDVAAATVTRTLPAHGGPVWSLALQPDGEGFATGGGDKEVKFWEFSMALPERDADTPPPGPSDPPLAKTLSARHMRTLRLTDDVLCVRFSPDGKLICVALLDATVKVFFADTLKFFLSLYGHKLPVLAMDVSSDGTLLASGGADKNIKLWGLDFGDCHRSIRAHDDSVTALAFVPRTHYLFSASKDRTLRYWDADKFEPLLTLPGHASEVWGLAVSSLGEFVVTAGHDRALRRWERTEEPFFVEEERERRLESLFEEGLEDTAEKGAPVAPGADPDAPDAGATALAGRRSMATLGAAESIVDALEMAAAEGVRKAEFDAEAAKARPLARAKGRQGGGRGIALRCSGFWRLAAAARLMIRDWATHPRAHTRAREGARVRRGT